MWSDRLKAEVTHELKLKTVWDMNGSREGSRKSWGGGAAKAWGQESCLLSCVCTPPSPSTQEDSFSWGELIPPLA